MACVAVLRCCTETGKNRSGDRNRPLTWVELRGFEPLTLSMRTEHASRQRSDFKDVLARQRLFERPADVA